MVDPTTVNRGLSQPVRGSNVGVWDTPVNNNMTLLDTIIGGIAFIATTGGGTVLNAAQLACGTISVSGALIGATSINFPAIQGWWSVQNLTTGSFPLQVASAGGGEIICVPPGEITDIQIQGSAVRFRNLGRIGSYIDYAGTAVPSWISSCTIPPYLNCDGSAFSSGTYPYLNTILGGTTLPDLRGRARFYLNGGTNRITTAASGINGDVVLSAGGDQNTQVHSHGTTVGNNSVDHTHNFTNYGAVGSAFAGGGNPFTFISGTVIGTTGGQSAPHTHAVTISNFGSGNSQNMPPAVISGITLIRAG